MANSDRAQVERRQQEQLLKMVTKGFYNELVNYGVPRTDIVTIASHLLGHVSEQEDASRSQVMDRFYSRIFDLDNVEDQWATAQRLTVDKSVSLRPFDPALAGEVLGWLETPRVRGSFVTSFPADAAGLAAHFGDAGRSYFIIDYHGEAVGIIGAENIDEHSRRLEMRKLVGRSDLQGMGIGKRATFAFLYWAFRIRDFEKVYIYSTDVNVRNLNINNQFGFELEGVLLQELQGEKERLDVVRMGLLRSRWLSLFAE